MALPNVPPRQHSSIDLTMNTYTDPKLLDVQGAVDLLPSLQLPTDLPTSDPEGDGNRSIGGKFGCTNGCTNFRQFRCNQVISRHHINECRRDWYK